VGDITMTDITHMQSGATADTPIDRELLERLTVCVGENLVKLRSRIDAASTGQREVVVIAVTKGFGPEAPLAALRNGLTLLGENYADELVHKARVVEANLAHAFDRTPEWHFQGRLQTNKINRLVPVVGVWQSLDSSDRVRALAKRAPGASVCIQVRLTDDPDRSGVGVDGVAELVAQARASGLVVRGLMGVGPDPSVAGREGSEAAFTALDGLCREHGLDWRSMGMSSDLEAAVACGATHVRIGTALFGERGTGRNV